MYCWDRVGPVASCTELQLIEKTAEDEISTRSLLSAFRWELMEQLLFAEKI